MKEKRILYITAFQSTFIKRDAALLMQISELKELSFKANPKWLLPFSLIKQLFQLISFLPKSDFVVCQYVSYHCLLPVLLSKLMGKKCILFLLGGDCHNYPTIGRGNFRNKLLAFATRICVKNASLLCPVHESLMKFNNHYDQQEPVRQGLKNQIINLKTPYLAIPYGIDSSVFYPEKIEKIAHSFITISSKFAPPVFENKGLDLIIEAAKKLPDFNFSILGKNDWFDVSQLPVNVHLIHPGDAEYLRKNLSQHEHYLQISISEGFPNALCEAMLCGCIPIGSEVYGIPDIVGNTGYILKKRDVNELVGLLKKADSESNNEKSLEAVKRIKTYYHPEKRLDAFRKILETK